MKKERRCFNYGAFDELFNLGDTIRVFSNEFKFGPNMDIVENDDEYLINLELPGFDEKDIDVQLNGFTLTISTKHEEGEDRKETQKYLLRERRSQKFSRTVKLPQDSDVQGISAQCDKGILEIKVPRSLEAKPRRITVSRFETATE